MGSSRVCRYQDNCRYKDKYCPFIHLGVRETHPGDGAMVIDPPSSMEAERAIREATKDHSKMAMSNQGAELKERIPKAEASIWKAPADGSCLFYSLLGVADTAQAQALRGQVAHFVLQNSSETLEKSPVTIQEALSHRGLTVEGFAQMVVTPSMYGGELEIFFIAHMWQRQTKVFMDKGEHWEEVAHYGAAGELIRLLYTPRSPTEGLHYDRLWIKERWAVEIAQQAVEEHRRRHSLKEGERVPVKSTERETKERAEARANQFLDRAKEGRKAKAQEQREAVPVDQVQGDESAEDAEAQETLSLLLEVAESTQTQYCVCQRPYNRQEYYIQCTKCLDWYHPKCLGRRRRECEAQRQTEGWTCGRMECQQPQKMEAPQEEKEKPETTLTGNEEKLTDE